MNQLSYINVDGTFTVVLGDNQPYTFDSSHPEYVNLVDCVKVGDVDEIERLIHVGTVVSNWSDGIICFKDGILTYNDEAVPLPQAKTTINMIKQGFDATAMINFLSQEYNNPSRNSREQGYSFLAKKGITICADGYVAGYKGVSIHEGSDIVDLMGRTITAGDYVDKYTQKSYRNNIGDHNKMPRRKVQDNPTVGCGEGLHIGTYDYAQGWAGSNGVVVLVKFSPEHIVSVPTCTDYEKLRVCDYHVVGMSRGQIEDLVYDDEELDDLYDDDQDYDEDYDEDNMYS